MAEKAKFYVDISPLHPEVTGSCIMNTIKYPNGRTVKLLIDCGLFQEREYTELNKSFPFNAEEIDHVIITHNHMDHIGRIPFLVKCGYHGKIHMTAHGTDKLIKPALYDGLKIFKNRFELFNEPILYDEDDIAKSLEMIEAHPYDTPIWLDEERTIKMYLFMNGHLPGACIVFLQIYYKDSEKNYDTINLLFTGDYSSKNMFFDVAPIPKWVYAKPVIVVQESTYGNMNTDQVEHVFKENIVSAVAAKKIIVVPVFSLGRVQEIMLYLKLMQDEGVLNKNIPVYYDGKLGHTYTKIYYSNELDLNENSKSFTPQNFTFVDSKQMRNSIINSNDCKIILCSSGMGTYGPSRTYLSSLLNRKNCLIHFTGYLAEDTMGRKIYEASHNSLVEFMGLQLIKRAQVLYTSEFSSHAKADELIEFLKPFEDLKMVLINHGEKQTKKIYTERIIEELEPKYTAILDGEYLYRVNAYGYVKSINTKFHPYQ